jgi:hypothetical protein
MRPSLPLVLISEILVLSQLAAASEPAASSHRQDSTSPSTSTSTSTSASPTLSPTSITLWDVGFSLWQGREDMRDEECPVPPDLVTAEMTQSESPAEAAEADFVSFEEWKRIKQAEDEGPDAGSNASDPIPLPVEQELVDTEVSVAGAEQNDTKLKAPPAHIHSRYNYASPDCSARIHAASPLTQHASSLLHKSRDRYMLTPCKSDEHWVVIELCDEIRIEAIELAVWEFFSGVVREVKVSVGEEDEVDSGEWVEVGAFVGKNVRGAQVRTRSCRSSPVDLRVASADFISPFRSLGIPFLLRNRVLLSCVARQGLWDEPNGGFQVGAKEVEREGAGETGSLAAQGRREGLGSGSSP